MYLCVISMVWQYLRFNIWSLCVLRSSCVSIFNAFLFAPQIEQKNVAQIDLIQFIHGNYIIGGLATMTAAYTQTKQYSLNRSETNNNKSQI